MSRYIVRKRQPRVYYTREEAEDVALKMDRRVPGGMKVVKLVPKRLTPVPSQYSKRKRLVEDIAAWLESENLYGSADLCRERFGS
jgi:hypothetical protein